MKNVFSPECVGAKVSSVHICYIKIYYSFQFKDGAGSVYLRIPENQAAGFCDRENIDCNNDYGHDVGLGSWTFIPGKVRPILFLYNFIFISFFFS